MKQINKIKNNVSINLFLAIMLFVAGLYLAVGAESIQKIPLNNNVSINNNIRFENIGTLACSTQACFRRPNDAVISSDGSFILVVDSSNPGVSGINLKRFNFKGGIFTDTLTFPLIQQSTNSPLLNIALNQNDTRAVIYREPTEGEKTLVQLVDLSSKTIKELLSVSSNNTKITRPAFLDAGGKKLIAGTLDLSSPQLVIIDVDADSIVNKIALSDKVESINVSPDFKQAIITYSEELGQSISVYDILSGSLFTHTLDEELSFAVDNFLGRVSFDPAGTRAIISSLGGDHAIHLLNLKTNKLTTSILSEAQNGPTISTISPDGKTVISAGSVLKKTVGFKIYKSTIQADGSTSLSNSVPFFDGSIVLDVDISPDQNKIYILELKNNLKQLKILNFKDLTQIAELQVSSDNAQSFLAIDPNGRYAITPNTKTEASVNTVTDLNSAPILKSIIPNAALVNAKTPFTIYGFLDPTKFTSDVKVCFKDSSSCATSIVVSGNGQTIRGITPKVSQLGLSNVTLTAGLISNGSLLSSVYEGVFQFVKEADLPKDNSLPNITISAPNDSTAYRKRIIEVRGQVDGTGSSVDNVLVNNIPATLTPEGVTNPNIVNFSHNIELDMDGPLQITVAAKDKSNNLAEESVSVIIDTILPTVTANIEPAGVGQFKVSGTANGTGTKVSSIKVNSSPVEFTESENVNFSTSVNSLPAEIIVLDKAGNKTQVKIANPLASDKLPPTITILSPSNGSNFKDDPTITVTVSVIDNSSVSMVELNGKDISGSTNNQYSGSLTLTPGPNSISITATDAAGNVSTSNIGISFSLSSSGTMNTPLNTPDYSNPKEFLDLDPSKDLNDGIIEKLIDKNIDIGNTFSVEIPNPPAITDGEPAQIELPRIEGLSIDAISNQPVPKGFSFATGVSFTTTDKSTITISDVNEDKLFTSLLVDATGKTFVVGLASLKPVKNKSTSNRSFKFQTTNGTPLDLITTLTIPSDASEGLAKVQIISKNDSLATIPLNVTPSKEVVVGKKIIPRPQIKEPVIATVKNQGTKLILIVKGKNFIGKIKAATIDGKLERLAGKGNFFTNVTFVPSEGIKINNFKVQKNKITLTATINSNAESGLKLFNIITPKGADIGGITFPVELKDGNLETTGSPESLLLKPTD